MDPCVGADRAESLLKGPQGIIYCRRQPYGPLSSDLYEVVSVWQRALTRPLSS
jgi:hypothetical protein